MTTNTQQMTNQAYGVIVLDCLDLSHNLLPFLSVVRCLRKHRADDIKNPLCNKGLKLPVLTIWEADIGVALCGWFC
ncbi:hypothetical protein CGJ43_22790 [Vibrio parahaemolyticus]|nr:hypothetical protein CGJ43_22790 [Vibrio parahaemolyticus]